MESAQVEVPSAAFFNPQSKAAGVEYLDTLQAYLHSNKQLHSFAEAIRSLPQAWDVLAQHRPDVSTSKRGLAAAQSLAKWIATSDSSIIANGMSGSLTLPLLTVIQICQYFQYLDFTGLSHRNLLESLAVGGVHGYCGGLLPAAAVAASATESDLVQNASNALRLAFAIGVYGDLGDDYDLSSGPTNMVIRLKYAGQGEGIVQNHPGVSRCQSSIDVVGDSPPAQAYISAVTDPKTISIVGPAQVLKQIKSFTDAQGLVSQGVHIRGKVHNPENEDLAVNLESFCITHDSFRLPDTSHLQVPVRSNHDGSQLKDQSLTYEVIKTILATRCEWYQLLHGVTADLERSGRQSHHLVNFGIGDCLSPIPFIQRGLSIKKSEARVIVKGAMTQSNDIQSSAYKYPPKAVAVVGMACRYPGAKDVEELWDLISTGTSTVKELPKGRVDTQKSFRVSQDQRSASSKQFYGNFIDHPDSFDHAFFGMNPREATYMDPQQRLLLETSYQALESSGYLRTHRRENGDDVGVFVGASFVEYMANISSHPPTAYNSVGTLRAFLCGRISHHFGWTGPAEIVDTACSSSLVAINRACKAIQSGECSMALAGGVNVISSIENYLDLGKAGFLSPTGQCKPFDEDGDGYCRSEGVGLLFLKPLDQALQERDHILGVICGAATNQGGLSSSITVPHSPSQVTLYRKILDQARMSADQVSYVEAHGTGTQVGDPLEIASIREVFGGPQRDTNLHIGSIKGNIGHCETAAGVAGCIKALLLLQKGAIPPLANHNKLNPKIRDLAPDRMEISLQKQICGAVLRAICVNSYGAAGSNAALLLCQPPPNPSARQRKRRRLNEALPFLLSASSKASLMAYVADLKAYLEKAGSSVAPADVAYTLAEKRQHHRFRLVTTGNVTGLGNALSDGSIKISETPALKRNVVLVFSGQVSRVVGMNSALCDSQTFQSHLERCNEIVKGLGVAPLFPALFQAEPISDVRTLHCCLFAQQYAFAQSWIDNGLQVDAVVGQSFGELTALAVANILSLEDALALVVKRASLIDSSWPAERGAMLSIRCSVDLTKQLVADTQALGQEVEIACYNADDSFVLGGTEDAVAAAEQVLQHDPKYGSVRNSRLGVTHAYHTKLTESILKDLEVVANALDFKRPEVHFEPCTQDHPGNISAQHVRDHMRKPVFFRNAIRRLEGRLGNCVWLEAGCNSPTFSLVKRAVESPQNHVFQPIKLGADEQPMQIICDATANLWREGISVSFWDLHSPTQQAVQQVWLPPYHFQDTRHWLPYIDHAMELLEGQKGLRGTESQDNEETSVACPPLIKQIILAKANAGTEDFEINTSHPCYADIVSGHAVLGRPLCPAGMYLACAAAAAQLSLNGVAGPSICFKNCSFESPLGMASNREVRMSLRKGDTEAKWAFDLSSSPKGHAFKKSAVHGKGDISFVHDLQTQYYQSLVSRRINELQGSKGLESLKGSKAYQMFSRIVNYSEMFQGIADIKFADTEAVAEVNAPCQAPDANGSGQVLCDAVSLDIFLQVCGLLINSHDSCPSDSAYLAVSVDSLCMARTSNSKQTASYNVYTVFDRQKDNQARGDVYVLQDGEMVVVMAGVRFAKVPLTTLEKLLDASDEEAKQSKGGAKKPNEYPVAVEHNDLNVGRQLPDDHPPDDSKGGAPDKHNEVHNLRCIIASHLGIPPAQISGESSLSGLGIDSLAAVELAEEISTRFGTQVTSTGLLELDFQTLCQHLSVKTSDDNQVRTHNSTLVMHTSPPATPSGKDIRSTSRQRLVDIVSQHCGHPASAVTDKTSLGDLGVDSLARIELKADIEAAFATDFDDGVLVDNTTIGDILNQVNPRSTESNVTDLDGPKLSSPSPPCVGLQESRSNVDPVVVLAEIDNSFPSSAQKHGFTGFWDFAGPEIDQLMLAYIIEAIAWLGADLSNLQPNKGVPTFKYLPKHEQLVQRLWVIIERFGLVRRDQGRFVRTSKPAPKVDSARLYSNLMTMYPEYAVDISLLAITGPELAKCLAGHVDPLKLLFGTPRAQQTLSSFYHTSPMFATMTDQLLLFIKRILKQAGTNVIKILEVGAGFGGTTAALAEVLQESGCEVRYTFTDVAPTLVDKARKTFAKYSWMDFSTLDLERDPPPTLQGKYDMVIATNVIHATSNLVDSSRRLKTLLKDGGFMCLSEITKIIDWHNLVFGLLPGWWCFNDGRSYALQSAQEWMEVFKKAGFETVSYSTGPSAEANSQQLLIASTRASNMDKLSSPPGRRVDRDHELQTVIYKTVDDTNIHADIYFPKEAPSHPMPIGKQSKSRHCAHC